MKIARYIGKSRQSKSKENVSFGKVILSLLLISFIVLSGLNISIADTETIVVYQYNKDYYSDYNSAYEDINSPKWVSDEVIKKDIDIMSSSQPLYYYDKYNNRSELSDSKIVEHPGKWVSKGIHRGHTKYRTRIVEEKHPVSITHTNPTGKDSGNQDDIFEMGGVSWIIWDWDESRTYINKGLSVENIYTNVKGSINTRDIIAENGTYPSNNRHTDGYWYVRKGLVNTSPTLSLSSPSENSYFGKEGSINLQGIVKDVDSDDILSIKYTINGISAHTNKTLSPTITANGNNQSFTRSIPIDNSITQGDHVLKVWAEDNKGGKSAEVSRTIKIDKTSPTVPTITANENWSKSNVTATIVSGTDAGSGVARTEYSLSGSTTLGWTTYISQITISNEGTTTIKARTIDKVGNISNEVSKDVRIDRTSPGTPVPKVIAKSTTEIEVEGHPNDTLSGLHNEFILWNRDNVDIVTWSSQKTLIDKDLKPNNQYSYKYKAKDNVGNTSDYSLTSKNYTLALNPVKVILKEVTGTSISLDVSNNVENINIPETTIELKEKGVNTTASSSNWGIDTTKTLTGLIPGKEYEVYINTRNGDRIENGSIKIPNPDIAFEDEFGNPVITITTLIPVENYNVSGSSVNTVSVSWNRESNQEYQVFLKDEFNNEITESRSSWIMDNEYTFSNLPLPNTKYIPYITTRRVNSASSLTPTKILNEQKAYTNAEGISKGSFESGEDFIEITLILDSLKNPADTEYELKNDVTGQVTKVLHSNPVWKNTNLAKESYYTYSVRVVNKNTEPSYFTKLVFINGEDPHTYIPDLNIDDSIIDKPSDDIIDLDELEDWDSDKPIWFNPEDLDGKQVKIDDEVFVVTKNKIETIKNKEKIEVANYAFSKEGFGYTDWKELKEGFFEDKIYFNQPGYYKTHFKFKNHIRESKPLIMNYIVDWIAPDIITENKIKGQSVVTGNNFEIRLSAEDNVSKFLFYSIDNGQTYYVLKENNSDVTFTNIEKTNAGIQNRLKIKVVDICGNIKEETFTVWGIDK